MYMYMYMYCTYPSGNLLTKFEDWEILMELISGLDTPLPDKESADSALQEIASGEKSSTDQSVLECVSIDQPVSTLTADEDKDRNECCYATVTHGNDLTQIELLKLMLTSLPPLMVNKLLSRCHGKSFGGKTREQLHSLLSNLTSIHTQQRYSYSPLSLIIVLCIYLLLFSLSLTPLHTQVSWSHYVGACGQLPLVPET